MHLAPATILAIYAATASARTFAVNHFYGKGNLVTGRMDPIVNPGVASGHVHAIQGGSNFALSMTDTQAMESKCTSSRIKNDNSNYWTPSLYFVDPVTGSIESVDMFYMNVYYFFETTTDKITAFKPGHRMVSGNPTLRSPPATGGENILDNSDGAIQPVQWTCPRSNTNAPLYPVNSDGLHGAGIQDPTNKGAGVGFPDQNCDGYASPLRADVHFPSCWNPAVGLTDYKNNMAWPTNGNCPTGWVHTPHLFYEVYWNTPKFASRWTPGQGKQPFILSNGDPTGYGLHGDFLSGWDEATLQQIIDNCDAGDAGMDKCPGLIGGVNDPSTTCNIDSAIEETIFGVLPALPGNNPIGKWGVDVAKVVTGPVASAAPVASAVPVASSAPVTSAAPAVSEAPAATSDSPAPVATTPPAVVTDTIQTLEISYTTITTSITKTVYPYETADPSEPTSTVTLPASWSYYGCYSDARDRVLSGIKYANLGPKATTNDKCTAYCDAAGFSMAGTEYSGQCFCGNALVGSQKVDESLCNMPCTGDDSQTCGGSLTLSVYAKKGAKRSDRSHAHFHAHHLKVSH